MNGLGKAGAGLAGSLAAMVLSIAALPASGWFGLGILAGGILSILFWFDLGRELRQAPDGRPLIRTVGLAMGLPQAAFGCFVLAAGLLLGAWVIYNSVWQRLPEYTGGFLTFGISPALVLVGAALVADAFRRGRPDGP